MRKDEFLYFLLNEAGEPYVGNVLTGVVTTGSKDTLLTTDGRPTWLQSSPEGWKDTLVQHLRNTKYWGFQRSFTVPMLFHNDAALIARFLYWKYGIEAPCKFLIKKNDRSTWPERHKTFYKDAELDFSKFKTNKIGSVTLNALEAGPSKYLKANENTVYEILIDDDPEHIYVKQDGVELTEKSVYNLLDGMEIDNANYGGNFAVPLLFSVREGRSSGVTFKSSELQSTNLLTYAQKLASTNWFAHAASDNTATINVQIKGKIIVVCTDQDAANGLNLRFLRSNLPIGSQNDYLVFSQSPLVNGARYEVDVNIILPLQPGERAYFDGFIGTTGVDTKFKFDVSELSCSFQSRYKPTYIKALHAYRVFQKLVELMTEGKYTVKSDFLSLVKDIALTSGNAMRGIPKSVLKTSMSDFFKFINIFMAGLGIESEKIVIEDLLYFFKNTETPDPAPLHLGQVDDLEIETTQDLQFNTVKIGWPNQEYEDVNGKLEFNTTHTYSTPITKVTKEFEIVSPYRGDCIGAELLRINFEDLTTTDKKDDNEVFAMNIETTLEPGGLTIPQHYKLYRPAYTSITGLPAGMAATVWNTEWTPKKLALKNGPLLRSLMFKQDGGKLVFRTGDKNNDLVTTLGGVTVTEKADVEIGTLATQLFLPHYYNFTTAVPPNLQQYMTSKPYETIAFTWKGVDYYGFGWDLKIKPGTDDKQTWKLLAAPNNNTDNHITKI